MSTAKRSKIDFDSATYRIRKNKSDGLWHCDMVSVTGNNLGHGKGKNPEAALSSAILDRRLRDDCQSST